MLFTSPLFHKIAPEDCPGRDIPIQNSLQPCYRPIQALQRAAPSDCAQQSNLSLHSSLTQSCWNHDPISLPCTRDSTEGLVLYDSVCKTNQWGLDPDLSGFQDFSANSLCEPHSLHTRNKEHPFLKHEANTQRTFSLLPWPYTLFLNRSHFSPMLIWKQMFVEVKIRKVLVTVSYVSLSFSILFLVKLSTKQKAVLNSLSVF